MRTFVISDIHGNNELFRKALKQVAFKETDKLILLGDLIDRGVDSKGVLDTVFLMLENGLNVECLAGNHERLFLDALLNINNLNQWLLNGGDKTLASFLTGSIEKIPKKYFDLIKSFKYYKEQDNYILVHAAINMKINDPFSDTHTLIWERNPEKYLDKGWLGSRKIIHGHSPESKENIVKMIRENEQVICIDNGSFMKKENYGSLCILQLENLNPIFVK